MAFGKKTTAPPSFEERIAQANARTGSAIAVFEQAANDLEAAADAQYAVADEIAEEIARLEEVKNNAWDDAISADSLSIKFRNLIS